MNKIQEVSNEMNIPEKGGGVIPVKETACFLGDVINKVGVARKMSNGIID